jgi:hypothetical protein
LLLKVLIALIRKKIAHFQKMFNFSTIDSATDSCHSRKPACRLPSLPFAALVLASFILGSPAMAQDVLTFHNDAARSGVQSNETVLSSGNVNSALFGKVLNLPADADIYAQPLYVSAYTMADGKTHNVLVVATAHDTVYAFDADGQNPAAGYLWKVSLLSPGETWLNTIDVGTQDINPSIGIVGTPVIDRAGGTVYLVSKSKTVSGTTVFTQRLHALNLLDGTEKLNGPTVIQASVPGNGDGTGTVSFNALLNNQRAALLLAPTPNGSSASSIFIAWASHGDNGRYHGWVIGYNSANISQQTAAWTDSPNGTAGGIWMSAGGLSTDGAGNIFGASGNGDFNANSGGGNYGDSLFKLNLTPAGLGVSDWFTPSNQAGLDGSDSDFGVGGAPLILPVQSGRFPHLMLTADKQGEIYLLNRDNLGHFDGAGTATIQSFDDGGRLSIHSNLIFFNNGLYLIPDGGPAEAWSFNASTGLFNIAPQSKSTHTFGCLGCDGGGSNFTISANGTLNSIVWAIDYSAYNSGPAVLYAFDATNLSNQIYASSQAAGNRDQAVVAVKFMAPTVANGKVYVGGRNGVTVYGLLGSGSQSAAAPSFSVAGGSCTAPQTVAITDATPNATVYYTLDGSAPTTSSTIYTVPLNFGSTTTLKAVATAIGYTGSAATTAVYTISIAQPAAAPLFSPAAGSFTAPQAVAITDATPNSTIYYTINGSVPTTSSTLYTGPMTFSSTTTLRAIATATGYTAGAATSGIYTITIAPTAAAPSFSPASGSFTAPQTVAITDATANAAVYYTTNGSVPTASSTLYTGPLTFSSTTTLKAIATRAGYTGSAVTTGTFTISGPSATATPSFSPAGGLYNSAQNVSIGDATTGATIYYTINGSVPTSGSTLYTGPITISSNTTLSAIATAPGRTNSVPATVAFTISSNVPTANPTITPGPGNYTTPQTVVMGDSAANAAIYYSINDTTPDASSIRYTGPFTLSATTTLRAVAIAPGYKSSTVTSETLAISFVPPTATPALSPAGGTFASAQTVTISDATPNGTIFYTTDGTAPGTGSPVYSGPITVGATATVRAIATASGHATSTVASATYTISALPLAAAPSFSPPGGSFTSAQTVTLSDTTPNASVYYTTDGSIPTTASTRYTAPVSVAASVIINSIATAPGFANSTPANAAYTIVSSGGINFSGGFVPGAIALNGFAKVGNARLRLTDGGGGEAASAFYSMPVNVQKFNSTFNFVLTNASADGFTFTIQGAGPSALGPSGGGLGYGPDNPGGTPGIASSMAIKFDLYNNAGESGDSTGMYTNGASPTVPSLDLSATGIDFHSGDQFQVQLSYDGTTLTVTTTDVVTHATATQQYPVNIPGLVGGNAAYVGFTAGDGGVTATQEILTWVYTN